MELPAELKTIDGAAKLYEWFGFWPSFHDAEVVVLNLNRRTPSFLLVHTWHMTEKVDERGYYVLEKHVLVEFVMQGVFGLSLNGFNHQNVLFGLAVESVENGFRLTLDDSYGIAGTIEASDISIRLRPGKPEDTIRNGPK